VLFDGTRAGDFMAVMEAEAITRRPVFMCGGGAVWRGSVRVIAEDASCQNNAAPGNVHSRASVRTGRRSFRGISRIDPIDSIRPDSIRH